MENIQDIYPLTPMQEGMLFHSILSPDSEVYKEQFACELNGDVNVNNFKNAWAETVQRHDILRTAFLWEDVEEPLQIVYESVELPFEYDDISELSDDEKELMLSNKRKKNQANSFDFLSPPLMRISLSKIGGCKYYLIWDHHHILFDGWGLPVLLEELMTIYESLCRNEKWILPPVYPYKSYIEWLKGQDERKAEIFWKDRLNGINSPTILKIHTNEKLIDGYESEYHLFTKSFSDRLIDIAKKEQITLNTLAQASWALLLAYYTNDDNVAFGSTVSGRNVDLPGIERMLGLFINTLPVRATINENKIVIDWLKEFQISQAELQEYEFTPLFKIQNWSSVDNGQALFNSIMVFENYPVGEALEESKALIEIKNVKSVEKTNYPLTVVLSPGKQIGLEIAYDTKLFSSEIVKQFLQRFEIILKSILENVKNQISAIDFITEDESKSLLNFASGTSKDSSNYSNIIEWFEDISINFPNQAAIVSDVGTISFSELNNSANRLASHLISKEISVENIVGVCLDRSINMVISLLAINKVGACLLPIDITYPEERINHIISDSNLSYVIVDDSSLLNLNVDKSKIINIDEFDSTSDDYNNSNPGTKIAENSLSYIIYTSGSTGKPKGVGIEHHSICKFVKNSIEDFNLNDHEKVIQFSTFGFDGALSEIFVSLMSVGTLYIPDRSITLSREHLSNYINSNEISLGFFPPSFLTLLNPEDISGKVKIVSVGDKCTDAIVERWGSTNILYNGYGPTETTIGATLYKCDSKLNLHTAPIGKGFGDVKVYLLDKKLNHVAIGAKGEIYISGSGVGRGYLNNPDLTAQKYLPDPYSETFGQRMYKTGDIATYLPDGNIFFIGRKDFQVKLRGYRIELSEIESLLNKFESIKDSAVTVFKENEGNEYLAAFIVAKNGKCDQDELYKYLREHLPEYMLPRSINILDKLPTTPNRKVDRNNLPKPDFNNQYKKFVSPANPTEELIANIWADILQLERVGRFDNFFELGGHSLLATQLVSRLRESFKNEFPINIVFNTKNLAELAKLIDEGEFSYNSDLVITKRVKDKSKPPLSYSQKRLWFLDKLKPNDPAYNIPTALRLKGNVNIDLIEESINHIIKKHEILRASFKEIGGKPYQDISNSYKFTINYYDYSNDSIETSVDQIRNEIDKNTLIPFKLTELPLLRCSLYKIADEDYILFVLMHHIISDGWSISVILNEFINIYLSLLNGKIPQVKELDIQFSDYAHWEKEIFESDRFSEMISYWKAQLDGISPLLELPYDKIKPAVQSNNGKQQKFKIEKELVQGLNELSRKSNATLFMTLLSVFQVLLSKYSNMNDIVVGTPIAGRINQQIEKLVGFFINNLAIRTDINDHSTFSDILENVRETTLKAYEHQLLPFDKLVDEIKPARDMSHQPIFQVMFVFQNLPEIKGNLTEVEVSPLNLASNLTNYDLTLTMVENDEYVEGIFDYNSDLFYNSTIQRIVEHFLLIISSVCSSPDDEIREIMLISEDEKNKIYNDWNNDITLNNGLNVAKKFEESVSHHSELPAVVFDDTKEKKISYSYSELNSRSNNLANIILSMGVKAEDRIAICMERHSDIIISVFGILKTGCTFLPIDPNLPQDRINYMIEQSECKYVIVRNSSSDKFKESEINEINIEQNVQFESLSSNNPGINIHSEQLAYLIFTSGSTGIPKGVMLHHGGLVNLANEQKDKFKISSSDRILQFSSASFDASVWEIVMALLNGASLYLTTQDVISDGHSLSKFIEHNQISVATLPPSVLAVIPENSMPNLKTLISAGESISSELVNKWSKDRTYFNAYGPTETTVCSSMLNPQKVYEKGPSIGKPINNFEMYILDHGLQPVGVGIPGELVIGGIGLARGYINNPELSAEMFIPNMFSRVNGSRLYRTGDLAKFLPNGEIEFIGRIDSQVKLRGFRIELGEIENVLKQVDGIIDAAVDIKSLSQNNERIVGYVVTENEKFVREDILTEIRNKLPEYMLPYTLVKLEEMPLTTSGKINKLLLPVPQISREDLDNEYVAPRNESEEKIVKIVEDLLNIEKVGIKDNFFELGGHSLLATQFLSRIKDDFGKEISLRKIFENPTIEGVVSAINDSSDSLTSKSTIEIKRVSRTARSSK